MCVCVHIVIVMHFVPDRHLAPCYTELSLLCCKMYSTFYVIDEPEGKCLYTETVKLYCIAKLYCILIPIHGNTATDLRSWGPWHNEGNLRPLHSPMLAVQILFLLPPLTYIVNMKKKHISLNTNI